MKKYSIILPVRNGGSYVRECVNSILAQTLDDFNCIVLDNCSTDGTTEWIASLNDPRIISHRSDKSLTIEENWSRTRDVPKNEFMTMIGHDDILDPQYLATMDRLIRKHPDASLYQAHFRYIDSRGGTIRKCKPMDERQSPGEFVAFFLAGMIDNMGTGYMMRSADYDAAGGIPLYPNLLFADFELWIRLSALGYKATAFEECFAFRLHYSTTTNSSDLKYQYAFDRFISYLENLQVESPSMKEAIGRYSLIFLMTYCKGLSHRLLRTPLKKRNGQTVASFVAGCRAYANRLVPDNDFNPYSLFSMRLARMIDRFALTRGLFLLFKKLYPTPIVK